DHFIEMVTYAIFEYLPMSFLLAVFYVASTFVCFVTSADSNTSAMAAISTSGVSQDNVEASTGLKVVWGTLVGVVAWVMISFADVNGIKTISVLGGLPACLLFIGILTSLITVIRDHETLQQNAESESP
ncbi:MAG: BCCT family transporter, partial [Planctomycetota bacterium]